MRSAHFPTTLAAMLWLAASGVHAIGIGRTVNNTTLGQPLNFAAFIRLEPDETLTRECIAAEVVSGDNRLLPAQVRATVEPAADPAERMLRVTTTVAIDEPVVTVNITAGCAGRISRSFVAFIDPPALNLAQAAPQETLPLQRQESQVAPIVDIARAAAPAAAVAPPADAGRRPAAERRVAEPRPARRVAAGTEVTPRPAPPRERVARSPAAAPPRAEAVPRLKLEAAPSEVLASARRAASAPARAPAPAPAPIAVAATPPAPAAAVPAPPTPAPAAASAALAAASAMPAASALPDPQQQRIAALEDSLRRLRAEAQATQGNLASLQAQLESSAASRPVNGLVYALAALCVLLAGLAAWLGWRGSRSVRQPHWWVPGSAPPAAVTMGTTGTSAAAILERETPADHWTTPPALDDRAAPQPPSAPVPLDSAAAPLAPSEVSRPGDPQPRRELSVEELIDLEQQADFFVVLGQDEAAIDLLMGHVRSTGGSSPLPYLKLLEIYRRLGAREAYERIRERFHRRFNANAPDWDADFAVGRALEEYPTVLALLQRAWPSPSKVMDRLDTLLFRRDDSAQTFDLPAYRELLFLYSIARDLAHGGGDQDVDLPLPIGAAPRLDETMPMLTVVPEAYMQTVQPMPVVDLDLTEPPRAPTLTRPMDVDFSPGSDFMEMPERKRGDPA